MIGNVAGLVVLLAIVALFAWLTKRAWGSTHKVLKWLALVPTWSEADFVKTIRTGVDPTGHSLNPDAMPWKEISTFGADDDLRAIYAYLHALTPIEKPAK